MSRLILWDIDGTIIRSDGLGALAFERAVAAVIGSTPAERVAMSGKTDPQIALEWLEALQIAQAHLHLPKVLENLQAELRLAADELAARGSVLPGVVEVATALAKEGIVQGILTGNLAPNALVKLEAFDLHHIFDLELGAFGSDHADRTKLVPIALERVRKGLGIVVEPAETWIVGDTPNDLACAKAAGARCLLVATGNYTTDQLEGLGADAVRPDLSDPDEITKLLAD